MESLFAFAQHNPTITTILLCPSFATSFISNAISKFCMPEFGIYLYRFESKKGEVQTGKVLVK
jgi:hypothetical protein